MHKSTHIHTKICIYFIVIIYTHVDHSLTIILYLLRHVVVYHMLYSWEIQTFGGHVCGD